MRVWPVLGTPGDTPCLEGIGFKEAPVAGQAVPLTFRARADAVSWVWVASRDTVRRLPGVILLWDERKQTCVVGSPGR